MKRAILLGWIVVLVCMAVLSQYRSAAAADGEENRITDSYRVGMYPVQNEGLNTTLANSLRWLTTHVPLILMRIHTHSTGVKRSGTTQDCSGIWHFGSSVCSI